MGISASLKRGCGNAPAFSQICRNFGKNVRFRKVYKVEEDGFFTVTINGKGRVRVDDSFYATDVPIPVKKGERQIEITVINYSGLPAAFAEGVVFTDETWTASFCTLNYVEVGANPVYSKSTDNVETFKFAYKTVQPIEVVAVDGGYLYDFGKETFGKLVIKGDLKNLIVYYGECKAEAMSKEGVVREKIGEIKKTKILRSRAFRYIFIESDVKPKEVFAKFEYLPYKDIGTFSCDDELVKKIYDVSAYTFRLCSREFYLDGIKRDRWVWAGDLYQSFMMNRYLCCDDEIIKRTIIALLGKPPYEQHINSINDYSAYLILSIYDYYFDTGDEKFVKAIYPRVRALFEFITSRLGENGFVEDKPGDWIFIDWGNFDKQGPHCAEQILYWKTACVMKELANIVKDSDMCIPDTEELKQKIYKYYYDKNLGGFTSWEDWKDFMESNLAGHIKNADRIFKENGAMQPTICEMLTGIHNSIDSWKLAECTDIIGTSCFDRPGRMAALYLGMADSMSVALDKTAFVVEAGSGPVKYVLPTRSPSYDELSSTLLQRASFGIKGLMYWCWRPRISDVEGNDFGLVRPDGKILEKTKKLGALATALGKKYPTYEKSERKSKVAVFCSQFINHLMDYENMTDNYIDALKGANFMLQDLHINSDFINEK